MSKRIDLTGQSPSLRVHAADSYGTLNDRDSKIVCCECGRLLHSLPVHLSSAHKEMGPDYIDTYRAKYPGAKTQSAYNAARISAAQSGTKRQRGDSPQAPTPITTAAGAEEPAMASALAAVTEELDGPRVTKWMELPCGTGKARLGVWEGWAPEDEAMIAPYDDRYEISGEVEQGLGQLALGIDMMENVLIIGPTGSGKTSLVNVISALSNQPVTRINFYGDMRPSDLVGDVVMVETEDGNVITAWEDGPLVTAMRNGHILLADELDAAPPQVHTVMQRVTERHHDPIGAVATGIAHCSLLLSNGELVEAHPAFRIVATANTSGQGDMSGDYAGTFVLNAAGLDRWGIKMRHGYPNESVWIKMVVGKTGIATSTAKAIVQAAMKVNEAKSKARCRASISPRKSLVWARIAHRIGDTSLAASMAILNGIDPMDPDHKTVGDIIKHVAGR